MKCKLISTMLTNCLVAASLLAQTDTSYQNIEPIDTTELTGQKWTKNFINRFKEDTRSLFTKPQITPQQVPVYLLVASAGVGLFFVDKEVNNLFQSKRGSTSNTIGQIFEPLGNKYVWGTTAILLTTAGYFSKNQSFKQNAWHSTNTLILTYTSTFVIKHLIHRHRPDDLNNPYLVDGPFSGFQHTAFVSGHSAIAFAMASYFSHAHKEKKWVKYFAYPLAVGVALSRLNANDHWASDVFWAGLLGFSIGKTLGKNYSKFKNKQIQ